MCPELTVPDDGSVQHDVIPPTYSSSANYTCSSGFMLVGDATRNCQSDGSWSGSEPLCPRTLFIDITPTRWFSGYTPRGQSPSGVSTKAPSGFYVTCLYHKMC